MYVSRRAKIQKFQTKRLIVVRLGMREGVGGRGEGEVRVNSRKNLRKKLRILRPFQTKN